MIFCQEANYFHHRIIMKFKGHHTNQACYKSGIISPEYYQKLLNPPIKPQAILKLH